MDLLEGLNPQQRQAVTAPEGPVLVLAGPGSGKTRVLAHRLAYLVQQRAIAPQDILAVTFTNKAAREMASRVESLLGGSLSGLTLGTFHAICARLLRREAEGFPFSRDFVIFDEADQLALVRQALKDLNLDPKQVQPGKVQATISAAKNELLDPGEMIVQSYFDEIVRRVYERYQQSLLANNALDFDDLLLWMVRLLRDQPARREKYQRRFRHILVDEFQDTNTAQYELLRLLSGPQPDLFVVGDPDQSIYHWRGADYRNVHRFQQDHPQAQVILLEQNYRSTQTILDAAMAVIDRQSGRHRKRLFTDHGRGEAIAYYEAYDEAGEARFVVDTIALLTASGEANPGDCVVMYRTNAQSRPLEEAFFSAGLPYRLVGAQRFYGRREVKDLIAYLRLIQNLGDQVSLLRVLNTPPRGIGDKTVSQLLETAARAGLSPAQVLIDLAGERFEYAGVFGGRAGTALRAFGAMLASWIALSPTIPLPELIDRVVSDIGYQRHLDDGTEEGRERWENVLELQRAALEFAEVGLTGFLEQVALVSDQDTLTNAMNAPTLLTAHAAKGLEFPVVFLIGLDEGVFPHQRSYDEPEAMAEERRLFYVGLTRAKDRLYLVRCFRRAQFGSSTVTEPSRFLNDIPADLFAGPAPGRQTRDEAHYERQTRWEGPAVKNLTPLYQPGMRVLHPTFGEGFIIESHLASDDEELTIRFERAGVKRLAASISPLQILEG
ncbi:MAG: UvrD-helicase domain-containing protein [Chloroflexota bacterium]